METSGTRQPTSQQGLKVIREWAVVIGVALAIALLVRGFFLQQFYISGPSMESTMFQDNRVLVNKLSYRLHDINRGDVVVFDRITTDGEVVQHDDLIKRVIALPGETVEIRQCVVFIDGEELLEPYLNDYDTAQINLEDRCRVSELEPTQISDDHIFVMGDNRGFSTDSRFFGPIGREQLIGQLFAIEGRCEGNTTSASNEDPDSCGTRQYFWPRIYA
jgi:signal peptidase I